MRKSNTKEFVIKSKLIHGNKYDYSKVEYSHNKVKVCITCPEHGEFWQRPHDHLSGNGCPKCKGNSIRKHKTKTLDQFISQANRIHDNKYDYSNVVYVNGLTKVEIVCPAHGVFIQSPQDHLSGRGCPKCSGRNFLIDDFINNSKMIHNNKYDYSKVNYINKESAVEIICPIHVVFKQLPGTHLRSHGCPRCGNIKSRHFISKGEDVIQKFLIENNISFIFQYDIKCPINFLGIAYIDFYLPDYNIFIEYNGRQHYEPISFFGGKDVFEKQQKRDNFVRNYCQENNIELIEISYKEINFIDFLKERLIK